MTIPPWQNVRLLFPGLLSTSLPPGTLQLSPPDSHLLSASKLTSVTLHLRPRLTKASGSLFSSCRGGRAKASGLGRFPPTTPAPPVLPALVLSHLHPEAALHPVSPPQLLLLQQLPLPGTHQPGRRAHEAQPWTPAGKTIADNNGGYAPAHAHACTRP